MNIDALLIQSAEKMISLQSATGYFPKGSNGPWLDDDTYVRTTAHGAMLIYHAYELTGETKYLEGALLACEYLISTEAMQYGYAFHCRNTETSDRCNGLIGQAWAIEPLIWIGYNEDIHKYTDVAQNLLAILPYHYDQHVWDMLEIDGRNIGTRVALNQQIWISAMSLILGQWIHDQELIRRGADFFEHINEKVQYIAHKGLIQHTFRKKKQIRSTRSWKDIWEPLLEPEINKTDNVALHERSDGYLSFLLYGMALAYSHSAEARFWKSRKTKKWLAAAVNYVCNNITQRYPQSEGYAWCYNPTGIELAYVVQTFQSYLRLSDHLPHVSTWIDMQINAYYDFTQHMMSHNTKYPEILSARLYEAIRLKHP